MALKYRKNYTIPYSVSPNRATDYWLEWWCITGKQKSCMTISYGIPMRHVVDKENFFLYAMNKKRSVLDCYKKRGRDEMYCMYVCEEA